VREGWALLQGIVTCGHCGRRLHVHYRGRNSAPGYHCCGKDLVNGRGVYCLNVGGTVIERAVADAFLQAITPAAIDATRRSVEQLQANHDAALSQWRLEAERTRYEAPGAPWQIRVNDELRARIVQQAPPEYVPMIVATAKLGVSRQTVLQRVKRGESRPGRGVSLSEIGFGESILSNRVRHRRSTFN
jgi:hypothetical protein